MVPLTGQSPGKRSSRDRIFSTMTYDGRIFPGFVGRETLLQFVQISERIAKAIDVIDAQSRERAFRNQPQNVAVGRFENNRIFNPNSYEISDGEKTAIIDALIQILPEGQFVILFCEQPLEEAKTSGIAFFAVDFGYIFLRQSVPLPGC